MSDIPSVDYRFGNKELITSFVTLHNPDIQQVITTFGDAEGDSLVEKVAAFIRDNFEYPMAGDMPLADGQLLRYTDGLFSHKFKCCRYYVWAFPSEVLQSKLGYCAETGNLAESLLLSKVKALVCLGEVRSSKDDSLLGLHAWIETQYKNETYVFETTIHEKEGNNLVTAKGVYNKDSDWAKVAGLYYIVKGKYDNKKFTGDADIVAKLGLPAKRVLLFGLEETQKMRAKRLYKELQREQKIMENLLKQAWGG